jgi:protein-tyrosine-phosphatase
MEILFICTGNTCRSAMAEKMLNHLAQVDDLHLFATSAGTEAAEGNGMSAQAIAALELLDFNSENHFTSRVPVSTEAGLILTATKKHLSIFANCQNAFTIKEFSQLAKTSKASSISDLIEDCNLRRSEAFELDINDPFDGKNETYNKVAGEILLAVSSIVERLKPLLVD